MIPKWVQSAIIYQIFPDRFCKSKKQNYRCENWDSPPTPLGFKGGDLWGVIDKLDYLCDLGINTIYFNPIFSSTANHRYHTYDYFNIDPLLGGNDAFDKLIKECHKRKIKVILDGVFNHASRGFFAFNHVLENGKNSPFVDWFYFNKDFLVNDNLLNSYNGKKIDDIYSPKTEEILGYQAWWNLPALPKFNIHHPHVRKYILDVAKFWIQKGIDGWRLDVPEEIKDPTFWKEFRKIVKKENPNCYLVGEIWGEAKEWLKGDQLDAVMNYLLGKSMIAYFFKDSINLKVLEKTPFNNLPPLSTNDFLKQIHHILNIYSYDVSLAQMNLMTSHDTPRLFTIANEDIKNIKQALLFLFTFPGAPCIYYGDEIGMKGGHDPDCRWSFRWDSSDWDFNLLNFYKSLIKIRHSNSCLNDGKFEIIFENPNGFIFKRFNKKEEIWIGFNNSSTNQFSFETNNKIKAKDLFSSKIETLSKIHLTPKVFFIKKIIHK